MLALELGVVLSWRLVNPPLAGVRREGGDGISPKIINAVTEAGEPALAAVEWPDVPTRGGGVVDHDVDAYVVENRLEHPIPRRTVGDVGLNEGRKGAAAES